MNWAKKTSNAIFLFVLFFLFLGSHLSVFGMNQKEMNSYFNYAHFRGYRLLLFDSAKGEFDPSFRSEELSELKNLWKKARHNFVYSPRGMKLSPVCLETSQASYVVEDSILKRHVIFLLNPYSGVYQWYENKKPLTNRHCCEHTQLMRNEPCVIGIDGTYFGFPSQSNFNEIMSREKYKLESKEDVLGFVNFYFNLTSRLRPIEKDNIALYTKLIKENYSSYPGFDGKILKTLRPPSVAKHKDNFVVSLYTFQVWAAQMPEGLTQWSIVIDKSGKITKLKTEPIFKYDIFKKKIVYGNKT